MKGVVVVWNYPEIDRMLNQRTGIVAKDMQTRANRVSAAAKVQTGSRTGALRASIHTNFERSVAGPRILVGSPLKYALMHHEGTRPNVIVAKPGGVLRFVSKGVIVHAKKVVNTGTRPNRFLTKNLPLALLPTSGVRPTG